MARTLLAILAPMETVNEAAARRFAEAITRGDREASLAVCDPEIEFVSTLGISGRAYLGHDGIREYYDDIESAWAEWQVDVERIAEGKDGRVAIVMTMHARGKGSGAGVTERMAHVWTVRDGRLIRNELHRDPDEALRELGLAPSRGPQ
jgi:ketosteroid isomerase-like protein